MRFRGLLDVAGMRSSAREVARVHGETRRGARGVHSMREGEVGALEEGVARVLAGYTAVGEVAAELVR